MTWTPGFTRSSQSWMPLGLPLRTSEADRRHVGRAVVGQSLLPVGGQELALVGDRVDVVREPERHHVGLEPVDDRARLLARAAVRLLDLRPSGWSSPSSLWRTASLIVGVELARRIVGDVEQLDLLGAGRGRSRPLVAAEQRRAGDEQDGEARAELLEDIEEEVAHKSTQLIGY